MREPITSLCGHTIHRIQRGRDNTDFDALFFYGKDGALLFRVGADDIFDPNGNRFEINTMLLLWYEADLDATTY